MKARPAQAIVGSTLGMLLLLFPAVLATMKDPVEATPENITKGQTIYKKHCQMCHGERGLGDGPAGKRLNPKPANFADREKMAKMTDDYLFSEITKGEGSMPAFERKLKPEERWQVIRYVRTFARIEQAK
jgi:mono/diheme cytochrome c family protein